jgi:hypothetical protein
VATMFCLLPSVSNLFLRMVFFSFNWHRVRNFWFCSLLWICFWGYRLLMSFRNYIVPLFPPPVNLINTFYSHHLVFLAEQEICFRCIALTWGWLWGFMYMNPCLCICPNVLWCFACSNHWIGICIFILCGNIYNVPRLWFSFSMIMGWLPTAPWG